MKDIQKQIAVRQMGGARVMDLQAFHPMELKITGIVEGEQEVVIAFNQKSMRTIIPAEERK